MPKRHETLLLPRLNFVRATALRVNMADGGGAVGTYALPVVIPVGAEVLACRIKVREGFAGDVSAVVSVGDGTDVDRYHTGTPSVLAAALAGVAAGVPSGVRYHDVSKVPVVTVTGNADFTAITAGAVEVTIVFVEFGS